MLSRLMMDFDKSLGQQGTGWHDYHLDVAEAIVNQFSSADWQYLQLTVASRPAYWQERCAEAIGGVDMDDSAAVLIDLLGSPHREVASIAATELDNRLVRVPMALESTLRDLLACLESERSTRSDDVRRLLENLK